MTATLTDHIGAIDPSAFDADNPTRPLMDREYAATLAETRLWGNTSYVPGQGNRRMVAKGDTIPGNVDNGIPSITVVTHDYGYGSLTFLL